MKASKMMFLCKWVKYEISVSSRSFFGGAPSLKLTTIAPANWMVGKMKNMFAFGAQTPIFRDGIAVSLRECKRFDMETIQ